MIQRSLALLFCCLPGLAAAESPSKDTVVVTSPADGGSPRNAANLTRTAANRYRLTIEQSETHNGVVIGQFMVEAANSADTWQPVTLDLAGAPNGYCYARSPSGEWRRIEVGEGGKSVQLSVAPGVTRIASIPWFSYGEYLAYVNSLRDKRVAKEVAFTDEGGKLQVYRLQVTSPAGVKNKMKICFGKAMHAHETSAFFMTQGIIEWLLSGDPAANLDNVVWTFYPCPDPKAAYHHLNYNELEKENYDTGKSGRATYQDDIAAGHHHLIQIGHMWNNEGHNLEFESYEYWDPWKGSNDKVTFPPNEPDSPLYRDWLAFWPHWYEWGTDTYWHRNGRNWPPLGGGAMMLNEVYFHGKDSGGDVAANLRRQGKEWARAVSQVYLHFQKANQYWTSSHPCGAVDVSGAVLLPKPAHTLLETLAPVSGSVQVNKNANGQKMVIFGKQYDHGLGVKGGSSVTYEIPAGVNALKAVVALDDAQADNAAAKFVVKLDGRELWRSKSLTKRQSEMVHVGLPGRGRLTLAVEGQSDVLANWAGAKFTVDDPDHPRAPQAPSRTERAETAVADGPIVIDPEYPHSFRYRSGKRFFPMGDTAYRLIGRPKDAIARYIDVRRAHKFNFVRMMAMTEGHWPFGGSPKKPDYTVIDEAAMKKLDWVFDYAASRGMNIELILWGYGVAGGEGLWANPAHQQLWIDTLVKRCKDRPNLFMYTVANEFERYPDGKYSYSPGDVEWAKGVAARIRSLDAAHPVGVHPSHWITESKPFPAYGGFTQRLPQVVWPLWETGSVNLNVTQNNEGVQTRTWGDYGGGRGLTYYPTNWQGLDYPAEWTATGWNLEGAGLEDSIAEDWAHGKPVLNTEFGYQHEPMPADEFHNKTRQAHQPSSVRKKAWKIATAGGYFAAGFQSTAVSAFSTSDIDNFRPAQLEILYDFFTTKTEYWKMAPHLEGVAPHNVLLARPGHEYAAYFPRGGANSVKLAAGVYAVEWLRAETGECFPQPTLTAADGAREFTPPNNPAADWVLHLKTLGSNIPDPQAFDEIERPAPQRTRETSRRPFLLR